MRRLSQATGDFMKKAMEVTSGKGHVCQLLLSQVTGNWETLLMSVAGRKSVPGGLTV